MDHRPRPTHPPPARPLEAVLDLGAVTIAPSCARAWTRQILWEWRLAGLSDTTKVIVSELTTNAVLASRREGRPCIRLVLTLDEGELAILVRDYWVLKALKIPPAPQRRTSTIWRQFLHTQAVTECHLRIALPAIRQ